MVQIKGFNDKSGASALDAKGAVSQITMMGKVVLDAALGAEGPTASRARTNTAKTPA